MSWLQLVASCTTRLPLDDLASGHVPISLATKCNQFVATQEATVALIFNHYVSPPEEEDHCPTSEFTTFSSHVDGNHEFCPSIKDNMPKMLGPGPFPRRPSGFLRYAVLAVVFLTALWMFHHSTDDLVRVDTPMTHPVGGSKETTPHSDTTNKDKPVDSNPVKPPPVVGGGSENSDSAKTSVGDSPKSPPPAKQDDSKRPGGGVPVKDSEGRHPIDKLIYDAQRQFAAMSSGESKTLEEAAQAYRKARGRHPPPHFDKWFEYAQANNAMIVEGFFDQVYEDLEPFWGIDPAPMRREASQFEMTINVRNGTAIAHSDWPWTKIWLNMTKTIEHLLPDMDIALNAMDEPRLVVPWEDINGYMKNASHTRKLPKAKKMVNKFRSWPQPKTGFLAGDIEDKNWESDGKCQLQPSCGP